MTDADDFVDDANNDDDANVAAAADDADDDDAYVLEPRWRKAQLSKWPWRPYLVGTFFLLQ